MVSDIQKLDDFIAENETRSMLNDKMWRFHRPTKWGKFIDITCQTYVQHNWRLNMLRGLFVFGNTSTGCCCMND